MKRFFLQSAIVLGTILAVSSCKKEKKHHKEDERHELKEQLSYEKTKTLDSVKITEVHHFMTKEEQARYTPDMVIDELEAGNERFNKGQYTARDHSVAVRKAVSGQYPKAYVLSCIDSRVPVEDVFDQGIGDLFVGRVAGNFADEDQLGSMEYATKVAGSKVIVVLGHANCGAIKGAIDDVKMGNLTQLLSDIKPAITMSSSFKGEKNSKNYDYVHEVSVNNIKNTIDHIRKNSPIIKEMEDKKQIKIIGLLYSLKDGHAERII